MAQDRRTFLKRSGVALSAAALPGCVQDRPSDGSGPPAGRLDSPVLREVGGLVLPGELGAAGREAAVAAFRRWADGYDAVPELNHGYGTSEIRYGPADPVPGWRAQLEALDVEARRRHGAPFATLGDDQKLVLLRSHVDAVQNDDLPSPLRARHVAVALLAHWAGTPEATDLCYGVRISPQTCRGLARSSDEPEPIP